MLFLKIAFRNILRHKGKSLVVGTILFIGSLVMMIGGGTITTMDRSVQNAMVDNFFGDLTLMAKSQEREDVFMQLMGENADVLPQFAAAKKHLAAMEEVEAYLPYTYGLLMMLAGSDNPLGYPAICAVIGTDIKQYQNMYSNIETLEGNIPAENTSGIFLSKFMRDMFYMFNQDLYYPIDTPFSTEHLYSNLSGSQQSDLNLKHEIILMGYSSKNSTMDVSVPIRGVFKYRRLNTFWREVSLLDLDSYRQCMNYTLESGEEKVSGAEAKLIALDGADLENLFSQGGLIEGIAAGNSLEVEKLFDKKFSEREKEKRPRNFDEGAFEFISVRLKPAYKKSRPAIIEKLNQAFEQQALGIKAVSWENTAGAIAQMVGGIRIGLYVAVFMVFVVAIIIIMNTLSMSVLERAAELGMMRAIGAREGFVSWMILGETFILNAFFGGLGILGGIPLTWLLSGLELPVRNEFLQLITGGPTYSPLVSGRDVLMGLAMLVLVTLASVIYPLWISKKVGPLDAVTRE